MVNMEIWQCMERLTVQYHINLFDRVLSQKVLMFYLFNKALNIQIKYFSYWHLIKIRKKSFSLKMFLPEDSPCISPPHWHGLGSYGSTQQPAGYFLSPPHFLWVENRCIQVIKWQPLLTTIKLDKSEFIETTVCLIRHLILIDQSIVWSVLAGMLI